MTLLLLNYVIVFLCQWLYMIVKIMNIRHAVGTSLSKRILVSNIASFVWLFTTFMGVNQMLQGNYGVVVFYLLGTTLGVYTENFVRRLL